VLFGLAGFCGRAVAQDNPVLAMIGTGNLGGTFGPALGRAGYPVVYGSRNPDRELVRALVERTGAGASAASPHEAAGRAGIIVLAVPAEVVEEVTRNLGDLDGKIVVDVSGGRKRVAADGYMELVSDSTNSQRLQSRHPTARVVRIALPGMFSLVNPLLLGTPPTVLIAGDDPRAREAVARLIFDLGLDPWDAGPLRFSRIFDAIALLSLIPAQQGRTEGYDLKLLPSVPFSCIFDPAKAFGFGRPYDLDKLPRFPRRDPPISCNEWRQRIGIR
ncbi:MAG TPA: NAD(P)-binding domain-containing protein, partial [Longimicrobiales bacterium]|nr:NAD(P)-binding domain-containing protein [Longimicrobiales bacterium]